MRVCPSSRWTGPGSRTSERWRQGDLEKLNKLPQSPNMNREIHNQPQISIGFIDFVVKPFIEALCHFMPGADAMLAIVMQNRAVGSRAQAAGPSGFHPAGAL